MVAVLVYFFLFVSFAVALCLVLYRFIDIFLDFFSGLIDRILR